MRGQGGRGTGLPRVRIKGFFVLTRVYLPACCMTQGLHQRPGCDMGDFGVNTEQAHYVTQKNIKKKKEGVNGGRCEGHQKLSKVLSPSLTQLIQNTRWENQWQGAITTRQLEPKVHKG